MCIILYENIELNHGIILFIFKEVRHFIIIIFLCQNNWSSTFMLFFFILNKEDALLSKSQVLSLWASLYISRHLETPIALLCGIIIETGYLAKASSTTLRTPSSCLKAPFLHTSNLIFIFVYKKARDKPSAILVQQSNIDTIYLHKT